jgi:hypothetical protein
MEKQHISPIALSNTPAGFEVTSTPELTNSAAAAVLNHINSKSNSNFLSLTEAANYIVENCFVSFKEKYARILPEQLASHLQLEIFEHFDLGTHKGDYITDEEELGYPNVYWRIVRAKSNNDVGPIHADRWFWDLNGKTVPTTHRRVKVWMPLIQNDMEPGLSVIPGSHLKNYYYGSQTDVFGKVKPLFVETEIQELPIPAQVKVGEAIVFNDNLLHGGRSTNSLRVSIEFTLACVHGSL